MDAVEDIVKVAGVVIAAAAAVFAFFQVVIAWRSERRREQPVVVAYQRRVSETPICATREPALPSTSSLV